MNRINRSGPYYRVADPQWENPLDASYSTAHGGRWNPKEEYAALYLNRTIDVARANARRLLTHQIAGMPITADDLEPSELPVLVTTDLDENEFLDIITDPGCESVGLPSTYPLGDDGNLVGWEQCQPIGAAAYRAGMGGVACRSAAAGAPADGEELARFDRAGDPELDAIEISPFGDWYGQFDW